MTIISLLSSLPYLHEILTFIDGSMQDWVPNFGIQESLKDENGFILNYSNYRYFLFSLFFNLFSFFGWLGWFILKSYKSYRYAILLPIFSISYQLFIVLSSSRSSWINFPEVKTLGLLTIGFLLFYFYFPKNIKHVKKTAFIWGLFFAISLLLFNHDIVTDRNGNIYSFIPDLGIREHLTQKDGLILGWNSYRALIFVFSSHLFAQIGWAGWFFDARFKLFRPFLLVPIIFNFYELTIITINVKSTTFSQPDWKIYTTIILALLIAINLYFNSNKALEWMQRDTNTLNKKTLEN